MKKRDFICGMLIGLVIALSATAFASVRTIEAFFNNIKVTVNGTELAMDVEPFAYNGRTMTPARFIVEGVCQALGASGEVTWNETTNTVEITVANSVYNSPISVSEGGNTVIDNNIPAPVIRAELPGEYIKDGLPVLNIDGKEYLRPAPIHDKYFTKIKWDYNSESGNLSLKTIDGTILIDSVPYIKVKERTFIEYDYYLNKILPLVT